MDRSMMKQNAFEWTIRKLSIVEAFIASHKVELAELAGEYQEASEAQAEAMRQIVVIVMPLIEDLRSK